MHSWLKYPKFGHAAATDYTARYIRYGMMTREEAIPIIKARDGKLDPLLSLIHISRMVDNKENPRKQISS